MKPVKKKRIKREQKKNSLKGHKRLNERDGWPGPKKTNKTKQKKNKKREKPGGAWLFIFFSIFGPFSSMWIFSFFFYFFFVSFWSPYSFFHLLFGCCCCCCCCCCCLTVLFFFWQIPGLTGLVRGFYWVLPSFPWIHQS